MELKEKLAKLRGERGMTQAELAEALNVSRQAVSKWERGITVPSTKKLACMGKLFGVPADDLLSDSVRVGQRPVAVMVEPEPEEKVRKPQTLKIAGAAALAGCILLAGMSIGIVIGVAVLKEPEKPKDGFTIVRQEDTEQEDIDWEKLVPFDGEIQDIEE